MRFFRKSSAPISLTGQLIAPKADEVLVFRYPGHLSSNDRDRVRALLTQKFGNLQRVLILEAGGEISTGGD